MILKNFIHSSGAVFKDAFARVDSFYGDTGSVHFSVNVYVNEDAFLMSKQYLQQFEIRMPLEDGFALSVAAMEEFAKTRSVLSTFEVA